MKKMFQVWFLVLIVIALASKAESQSITYSGQGIYQSLSNISKAESTGSVADSSFEMVFEIPPQIKLSIQNTIQRIAVSQLGVTSSMTYSDIPVPADIGLLADPGYFLVEGSIFTNVDNIVMRIDALSKGFTHTAGAAHGQTSWYYGLRLERGDGTVIMVEDSANGNPQHLEIADSETNSISGVFPFRLELRPVISRADNSPEKTVMNKKDRPGEYLASIKIEASLP